MTRRKTGSAISSGSTLLPSVDGRSVWARLMKDTYNAIVLTHLGDNASELERLAARRISTLEAELVHIEAQLAALRVAGKEPEPGLIDLYSRISNTQRRLAESLGWQRRQRAVVGDVTLADMWGEP